MGPSLSLGFCWGEGVSLVVTCAPIAAGGVTGVTASHTGASWGGGGGIHQRLPIPAPAAPAAPTERPRSTPGSGRAGSLSPLAVHPSSRPSVAVEGQAEHPGLCVYLCVHVCTSVCMYVPRCACVYLCAHLCAPVYVPWVHASVCARVCICVHMSAWLRLWSRGAISMINGHRTLNVSSCQG